MTDARTIGFTARVALITGGTGGIGKATAARLAAAGAKIALSGRQRDAGERIASDIRSSGGDAHFVPGDITQEKDVDRVVDEVIEKFGGLDIAFNNAGVLGDMRPVWHDTAQNFEHVFDTNVRGTWLCMRRQLRHFVEQGSGVVINNSSVYGSVAIANFAAYVASKHAIEGLTKAAALETAQLGVRVNAVSPAGVRTDIRTRAGLPQNSDATLAAHHPMGRLAEPDEVAGAVAYLASDDAAFITGTILHLDGGYLAQ